MINEYLDLNGFPDIHERFKIKMDEIFISLIKDLKLKSDEIFTSLTKEFKLSLPLKIAFTKASIIFDKFTIPSSLELIYKINDTI